VPKPFTTAELLRAVRKSLKKILVPTGPPEG
jgi:hypothetical protein